MNGTFFADAFQHAFDSLPDHCVIKDRDKDGPRFREKELTAFLAEEWPRPEKFVHPSLKVGDYIGRQIDFVRMEGKVRIASCELKVYLSTSNKLFTTVANAVLMQMHRLRTHKEIAPYVCVILYSRKNESHSELEGKMKGVVDDLHEFLRVRCLEERAVPLEKGSHLYLMYMWKVQLEP